MPEKVQPTAPEHGKDHLPLDTQVFWMWDGSLGALGQNQGTESHWLPGTPMAANQKGFDGLESQAIVALSTHRMSRFEGSILETNPSYVSLWEAAFPGEAVSLDLVGLAIAAYERTLFASQSPFQRWLRGEEAAMTQPEKRGALVFFNPDVGCETCHTGPALSGPGFYALGMPDLEGPGVLGTPVFRGRGAFVEDTEQDRKFKVPQLYNLADSPFLGHGGTFTSVEAVVRCHNQGEPAVVLPPGRLESRFVPLQLSEQQVMDLTAFIGGALRDRDLNRYVPGSLPSGNCFPANDSAARRDLGCG
ncbi:MAG: cytochrome c peroxidase [Rhodothermales bacterium]|jgi:cytochrome c peroxidase